MKKIIFFILILWSKLAHLQAQCGACPSAFTLNPTLNTFTTCPSINMTCGITWYASPPGSGTKLKYKVSDIYFTNAGETKISFTVEKCTWPQGGSPVFSTDLQLIIRDGNCGNVVSLTTHAPSNSAQINADAYVPNFTSGTKTFYGYLQSGGAPNYPNKFWIGTITITAQAFLDKVCITNAVNEGPDKVRINLSPTTIQGANARLYEYKLTNSSNWTVEEHSGVNVSTFVINGLQPNTSYDFRVRAKNSDNGLLSCNYSNVLSATTQTLAIDPPPYLNQPTTNGPTSVNLSWTTTSNTTGYEIERKTINQAWGSATILNISGANTSSYVDASLGSNVTYNYRMRAKNTNTNPTTYSLYSNIVTVTTPVNQLPAPQLLTVTPNGATMNLQWSSVAGAAQYAIDRKLQSSGSWTQIYLSCCATPLIYADPNLPAGSYCYRVRAVDGNSNQGLNSNELCNTINASASLSSCTVSPTPIALGSNLTINWNAPNNAGSTVRVELLNTGGSVVLTIFGNTVNDGTEVWTVAGVAAGTYAVKVSSIGTPTNAATTANFSILPNASNNIVVTAPPSAASWAAGTTQNITWTSAGIIGNVKVELVSTTGSVVVVINANIPNTSPYSWTISTNINQGSNYKIRITSLQNPSVFGQSATFTITNSNMQTCSCSPITNPPTTSVEENAAATYLCQHCILDDPGVGGNINPQTNIQKQDLAKVMFKALFGNTPPAFITNQVELYPNPYQDMNGNDPYQQYGRVMLYLEYGDGKSPLTRKNYYYYPTGTVTRAQVCKVICESFNIPLSVNPASPYSDVTMATEEFAYIRTCYDKGIINPATNFNPTQAATRIQAFLMLYRYLNGNGINYPPNIAPSVSLNDFAVPDNLKPDNINNRLGISDAIFDDYSEVSFNIPDKQMALTFAYAYSTALVTLPDDYFGFTNVNNAYFDMRPFNYGWTHNYHAYIKKMTGYTGGINGNGENQLVVVWPDGSMNVYKDNGPNYTPVTLGLFDAVTFNGTNEYTVKKKDQTEYRFTKISGSDVNAPFMLTSIRDRNNNQITLNYSVVPGGAPRLATVKAPSGRLLSFSYSGQTYHVTSVQDPLNRTVFFNYSIEGTLSSYKDADGFVTAYHYAEAIPGLSYFLTEVVRPKGNKITNTYDAIRRKLASTTVVNNGVTHTRMINNFGWNGGNPGTGTTATIHTDDGMNAYNSIVQTNAHGDLTNITNPTVPAGAVIAYADPNYPTLPTTVTAFGVTTKYEYSTDTKGNVTKITQDQGGLNYTHIITYTGLNDVQTYQNPRAKTTTFVYGDGLNLTAIQQPIGTTAITYLAGGLVDVLTNPEGIQTKFEYNAYGNVRKTTLSGNGTSVSSTAEYDAASRMIKAWDANGKLTQFDYNGRDLPTQETNPLNYHTSFEYDNNGNLIHITNPRGSITQLQYDNLDQVVSESFGASVKQYQYWNDGKLKKIIKPDGTQLNYAYNTNDGLLANDDYATYGYDGRKRLQTVNRNGKAITYGYDNIDRVISISYDGQTVGYGYDQNSNITTLTYPGSKIVIYAYDDNDRLLTVKDWNNQTTTYTYKLDGRLNTTTYPNGIVTTNSYDGIGRMTGILTQKPGFPAIYNHSFINDNNGNHVVENRTGPITTFPTTATATVNYTYTLENRIQQAGNTQFTFDANGNTQAKSGSTYGWDSHDMLTSVSGGGFNATYEYDGLGNRRRAVRGGTATKYVLNILGMSQILLETNDAGTVQYYYVYGLGLISRLKPDNTTRYYHSDFRGSTVAMTDATATVTHKYQYDEFGAVLQKTEQDENRFRFVGLLGVMQEDSLLYFMRARYYDAEVGRFLSEDPIWSVNLYAYVRDNPIVGIDPQGLETLNHYGGSILYGNLVDMKESQLSILEDLLFESIDVFRYLKTLSNKKYNPNISDLKRKTFVKMSKLLNLYEKNEDEVEIAKFAFDNRTILKGLRKFIATKVHGYASLLPTYVIVKTFIDMDTYIRTKYSGQERIDALKWLYTFGRGY